jgi:hypothetical protein
MSASAYSRALEQLARCSNGTPILAALWEERPIAQVRVLAIMSARNPDQRILDAVIPVVRDPALPDSVRLAGAQLMMRYAWPDFGGLQIDADTSAPQGVRPEVLKYDLLVRRSWVRVSVVDHPLSDRLLPNARQQVLPIFDQIVKSEPETRFGKIVEVLAYWLRHPGAG